VPSELSAWWTFCWNHLTHYYQVDPLVFVALYALKSVVFFWTLARIVALVRRRCFQPIPALALLNLSSTLSPWTYVWLCGRNLPEWYTAWLGVVLVFGLGWLVWSVCLQLRRSRGGPGILVGEASGEEPA
jgi:hypothetical protein